jgi:hypothetical protein
MLPIDRLLRIAAPSAAAALAGAGVLIVLLDHPASSASRMTEVTEPAAATSRPCEQQTWPHIDRRCLTANATHQAPRKVRLVTTDNLATLPVVEAPAPVAADAAPAAAKEVVAIAPALPASPPAANVPVAKIPVVALTEPRVHTPKPVRRAGKHERRRNERGVVQRTYEVPAMAYDAPRPSRQVTVTTPTRFEELFSPRY